MGRLQELGECTAQRLDQQAWRVLDRFEPVSRAIHNVTTTEAFNLGLILAAQAFLTLVPLVIVIAAFAPRLFGVHLSVQLMGTLGLANSSFAFHGILASPGRRVAQAGGVVGLVLLLSAGVSFVAALQRAYEKTWHLPRLGVVRSSWRYAVWLAGCLLGFLLSGLADAALPGLPGSTAAAVLLGLAGALLFWWWTLHLLLGGRVGWRALLPSAVLTGGQLAALARLSALIMPTFVDSTEGEFGPIGTVFVVMIWLTIVCSMVVFGAIIGEVIATDRRVAPWTRQPSQEPSATRHDPASPAGRAGPVPPGLTPGTSAPGPPPPAASEKASGGTGGSPLGQGDTARDGRAGTPGSG
jgi:membrane protein